MQLNLNKISDRKIQFEWEGPFEKKKVQVFLPKMESLKYDMWGDWGPMYEFKLNPQELIKISYNLEYYSLEQRSLTIESPMEASVRKKFPFYLVVNDPKRGRAFKLFLDKSYELAKIEVSELQCADKVFINKESKESFAQVV